MWPYVSNCDNLNICDYLTYLTISIQFWLPHLIMHLWFSVTIYDILSHCSIVWHIFVTFKCILWLRLQTYFWVVTLSITHVARRLSKQYQSHLNNVWQTWLYDIATHTINSCHHILILVTLCSCVTCICHICIYVVWQTFHKYLNLSHVSK